MDKYIAANDKRTDARIRYSAFIVGMDILQKSKKYTSKKIDGYFCFEKQEKIITN